MLVPLLLSAQALAPAPVDAPTVDQAPALDRAAQPLTDRAARSLGVGAWVPDASGLDLAGRPVDWRSASGERGTVIALTSLTCPLCQKFFPELARTEERALESGFGVVHVALGGLDAADDLREHARVHDLSGLVLRDTDGALARALDARTTTEVFVVDAQGTLRYRGAINDQYGIGFALPEPRHRWLDDALRSLLLREDPAVQATTAPGCVVERSEAPLPAVDVDYARHVSRLMDQHCVECHRAGGVAPFALETYDDVARRASMLAAVVDDGLMPPWFAAHASPSPWANDRSMLPEEKALLRRWIEAGKPRGDDDALPAPRQFAEAGWQLGEPDAVYALRRPFTVPAEGRVDYQYTPVPTGLEEDRWVRALEVRPDALEVVHHVVVYPLPAEAFEGGRLRRWDLLDERRGFFAAWAPGSEPVVYPEGHARRLPAGTVLLFEMHYTPNGREVADRSSIGVHFAPEGWSPDRVVRTAAVSNRRILVPAETSGHVETAVGVASEDVLIEAFMPHMHLRGAAFRYDRVGLDGARETLLDVPRYDFNWQLRYELAEPLRLRRGERIDITGVFDNSSDNFANPAPERRVRWGPDTDDEMFIGFVDYVLADEDPERPDSDPPFVNLDPGVQEQLRSLAANNGGVVPRAKLPRDARRGFDRLDTDGDGRLTARELTILDGSE